jgi:hypothetical protein
MACGQPGGTFSLLPYLPVPAALARSSVNSSIDMYLFTRFDALWSIKKPGKGSGHLIIGFFRLYWNWYHYNRPFIYI